MRKVIFLLLLFPIWAFAYQEEPHPKLEGWMLDKLCSLKVSVVHTSWSGWIHKMPIEQTTSVARTLWKSARDEAPEPNLVYSMRAIMRETTYTAV